MEPDPDPMDAGDGRRAREIWWENMKGLLFCNTDVFIGADDEADFSPPVVYMEEPPNTQSKPTAAAGGGGEGMGEGR